LSEIADTNKCVVRTVEQVVNNWVVSDGESESESEGESDGDLEFRLGE